MSLSPLEKAIQAKQNLTFGLKELQSLVDTSYQALRYFRACETASIECVLSLSVSRLHELLQTEQENLKQLKTEQQGGDE